MPSYNVVIKAPASTLSRKAAKGMGHHFLQAMKANAHKGDHILIPATIPAGKYTFDHKLDPDGYEMVVLTPGTE